MRSLILIVAAALSAFGCGCEDELSPSAPENPEPKQPAAASSAEPTPAYDLLRHLDACEVRHRGLSLDLGTSADKSRRGYRVGPFTDSADVERGGATFSRLLARRTTFEFWLDQPIEGLFVSARVHGGAARRMTIALDDRRLGTVKLAGDETRIVSVPPLGAELSAGRHTVSLGFTGKQPPPELGHAEVDWLRVAVEDDISATYAAPTREDVVGDVVLDGTPRRSIVLRAPGTVRCPVHLAPDAKLSVALGFWGAGRGTAEIRLVFDDREPLKLHERKIAGGAGATWIPMEIPLGEHASRVVGLELSGLETSRGGRVVFGDPSIVRESPPPRAPTARTVVVVVLAGLDRRHVPPWGVGGGLTAVAELARRGVAFSGYRVPSTVTASVMASLLTGLPPRAHALEDPAARLPESVRTSSELFKEAGERTAMFTGVPTTFGAFGFDVGWDEYRTYSPVKDVSAVEPLLAAAKWLESALDEESNRRRFVLVHARGAHPPWDLSREEVAKLPPEEYGGALDARRGGITLANLRARRKRSQRRLEDLDWIRLRALERAALARQNDGLSKLVAVLERKAALDDTLFVLMGDVAPGAPPEPPFDPAGPLAEDRLLVPLVVKFPGDPLAAKEVNTGVTTVDITRTLMDAFGLAVPSGRPGLNLFAIASGSEPLIGRPTVAVLGDGYATQLGTLLLSGDFGRVPKLCRLDVDPACLNDVHAKMPIAAARLWQWTHDFEVESRSHRRAPREPASVDSETAAALTVWGDL